jgi:hypothetical protein
MWSTSRHIAAKNDVEGEIRRDVVDQPPHRGEEQVEQEIRHELVPPTCSVARGGPSERVDTGHGIELVHEHPRPR